jgi:hypothetical protein
MRAGRYRYKEEYLKANKTDTLKELFCKKKS